MSHACAVCLCVVSVIRRTLKTSGKIITFCFNDLHSITVLVMATFVETDIQSEAGKCSRKKRKRNRFIKQGYHRSERDDARRIVARTFLAGIPLDSQSPHSYFSSSPSNSFHSYSQSQQQGAANTLTPQGPSQRSVSVDIDTIPRTLSLTHKVTLGSPKYVHKKLSPLHSPHPLGIDPLDRVLYEPNESFDRRYSTPNEPGGGVCVCHSVDRLPPAMLMDKRIMLTSQGNSPASPGSLFAISSVISYKRRDQ